MATGTVAFPAPLFCLGGTIYPVDRSFDWSHDRDVLVDAIRETHQAMRMHNLAALCGDRSWLTCECFDVAEHRDRLIEGHAALLDTVLTFEPEVVQQRARSLPVMQLFMRSIQTVVVALGTGAAIAACSVPNI